MTSGRSLRAVSMPSFPLGEFSTWTADPRSRSIILRTMKVITGSSSITSRVVLLDGSVMAQILRQPLPMDFRQGGERIFALIFAPLLGEDGGESRTLPAHD